MILILDQNAHVLFLPFKNYCAIAATYFAIFNCQTSPVTNAMVPAFDLPTAPLLQNISYQILNQFLFTVVLLLRIVLYLSGHISNSYLYLRKFYLNSSLTWSKCQEEAVSKTLKNIA